MSRIQRRVTVGDLHQNPAWFGHAIADNYGLIQTQAPHSTWIPELYNFDLIRSSEKGYKMAVRLDQYGCGAYGCVVPTSDPSVVFKITTDESEARFIADILPTLTPQEGCVRYHQIVQLAGERDGRSMFGIWRESASRIGEISLLSRDLMRAAHEISDRAIRYMADDANRELMIEMTLSRWEDMAEHPELARIGATLLGWYRDQVFIGDVHANNVGWVHRDGADILVITDPGHAVLL